jgi:hypothetical protein
LLGLCEVACGDWSHYKATDIRDCCPCGRLVVCWHGAPTPTPAIDRFFSA